MFKLKLNTNTKWVPQYMELDDYMRENADGVRTSGVSSRKKAAPSEAHALLGDANFIMFHDCMVRAAALHGYLQKSTASDLLKAICSGVEVVDPPESEDEDQT